MVLAHALSRAQRFAEAVEVLDRASSSLDARRLRARAPARGRGDAPRDERPRDGTSVALRRETLRERAAGDPAAPPELPGRGRVHLRPHERARRSRRRPCDPRASGRRERTGRVSDGRPWFSFATWFSQATFSLLWAERYAQVRPLLDASIAQARATGDSSRLAIGLANRGWLALRRGDLSAAEGDARTALAATELPAPPMYRVLNVAVLVKALVDQGELDAAEEALAPLDSEAESGSLIAAVLRFARGRLRVEQGRVAEGLEDFLAVGALLTRAQITCPGYLPWRSEAALAQLALGDRESAERLAEEELELARAFGAPRALGVAMRAAGVVAGGERGASLLREAIERVRAWRRQAWNERALSPTSAPCSGGATGAPKLESSSARHSTPPTARAPDRSPTRPRPSSAPPARGRAGSCSPGSTR